MVGGFEEAHTRRSMFVERLARWPSTYLWFGPACWEGFYGWVVFLNVSRLSCARIEVEELRVDKAGVSDEKVE